MRFSLLGFLALAFALTAFAGPGKGKWPRLPASETKLDLSLASPENQYFSNEEARRFYELLVKNPKHLEDTSQKTLAEFKLLQESLERRGYKAIANPLGGSVFVPAQTLNYTRGHEQKIPAMNGEEAYTSLDFKFDYAQTFLEKGKKPGAFTNIPFLRLEGYVLVNCPEKNPAECTIAGMIVEEAGIHWGLPNSSRGANSSAGGANQK